MTSMIRSIGDWLLLCTDEQAEIALKMGVRQPKLQIS